jgi:[ribosomal protein S5]-alanine N-acetyltransferase
VQPDLVTSRLKLRAFSLADAAEVQRLAGDAAVADMTMAIPHPYPDGAAEEWISSHEIGFSTKREVTYAVTRQEDGCLLGAVALLGISQKDARCELGYWIGREYWSRGYCTEAAARLVVFAYEHLSATRIVARCLARNPASARVMVKLAMQPEGRLTQHVNKNGTYEDVLLYGLNLPGRARA